MSPDGQPPDQLTRMFTQPNTNLTNQDQARNDDVPSLLCEHITLVDFLGETAFCGQTTRGLSLLMVDCSSNDVQLVS